MQSGYTSVFGLQTSDILKMKKIAIIGGSGFENPEILKDIKEVEVETPYGKTTSTFKTGKTVLSDDLDSRAITL